VALVGGWRELVKVEEWIFGMVDRNVEAFLAYINCRFGFG
jgi:hypothetical protein